mgnify:CR=1 FL=1
MADMKQVQTALELFFNENGRYPTTDEWNSGTIISSSSGETFMYSIPSAPSPADGDCLEASNTYVYTPQNNGASYTIDFCTGKQVSDLPEGAKQMTPGGIIIGASLIDGGESGPIYTSIKYGYLYNGYASIDRPFIDGWDVANMSFPNQSTGGGQLKSTRTEPSEHPRWNSPNTNASDSFGLGLVPGGQRDASANFGGLGTYGSYFVFNYVQMGYSYYLETYYDQESWNVTSYYASCGRSLRLSKAWNTGDPIPDSVTDYDGNVYPVVLVGNYLYTATNLAATHYADGTEIPYITDNATWYNATTPALCAYNHDLSLVK